MQQDFNQKGKFWINRPVHGLLACYKRCYRILFFTIFLPEMVLADGWTTIEAPQPWCQEEGRPHHPTWTLPPPPHPPLFELKETTFSSPRATRTIHLHPIMPHVSLDSCQFPRLEAFQNTCFGSGDHYPSLMIISIYIFFCLQKCQSFFLISRYSGL